MPHELDTDRLLHWKRNRDTDERNASYGKNHYSIRNKSGNHWLLFIDNRLFDEGTRGYCKTVAEKEALKNNRWPADYKKKQPRLANPVAVDDYTDVEDTQEEEYQEYREEAYKQEEESLASKPAPQKGTGKRGRPSKKNAESNGSHAQDLGNGKETPAAPVHDSDKIEPQYEATIAQIAKEVYYQYGPDARDRADYEAILDQYNTKPQEITDEVWSQAARDTFALMRDKLAAIDDPAARPRPSYRNYQHYNRIFGQSFTKAVHWMSQNKWSLEEIRKILNHFDLEVNENTLRTAASAGRNPKYCKPATFTKQDINELTRIRMSR